MSQVLPDRAEELPLDLLAHRVGRHVGGVAGKLAATRSNRTCPSTRPRPACRRRSAGGCDDPSNALIAKPRPEKWLWMCSAILSGSSLRASGPAGEEAPLLVDGFPVAGTPASPSRRARSGSARCPGRSRRRSAGAPGSRSARRKTPGRDGNTRPGRSRTAGTCGRCPASPTAAPCRRVGARRTRSRTARGPGRRAAAAPCWVGRADRGCSGWCRPGPQRQPWNGHSTQSPTTLPPWPMCAPRWRQCARQDVQFARLVAIGDQVFAEVPQRPHLAGGELGRPADHEPAGDFPGERDFHAVPPST